MATYLPVYCASCAHASLSPFGQQSDLRCSFCEASARVIPGPVYDDGDWLAFAEIDQAVFEAELDGVRASALADELQLLLDSQPGAPPIAQQMIQLLPTLANVRPALVSRPPRGPRMLMTLLVARARDMKLPPEEARASLLGPSVDPSAT